MYTAGLKQSFSPEDLYKLIKYKIEFRRAHPYYFDPFGTCIFCGPQGSGKTLSAVNYIYNLKTRYPFSIICSNIALKDYPFNAHIDINNGHAFIIDDNTGAIITTEDILQGRFVNVCVEYMGLEYLKYLENDEYGVIFVIDEIHLELNSLESQNIDIDVMIELSQQRKQRKHIVGTSQVFMRMAKPVREQVFDIILCREFFSSIQFNKLIDGTSATEENGKLVANVRKRIIYTLSPEYFERYDTYAKMKRYKQEWKGRAKTPVNIFEPDIKSIFA